MEKGNDFQQMVAWKRVVRYVTLAVLVTIAMVASSTKYQWIKLEGPNELPRIWLTLSLFTTLVFSVWLTYGLINNKRYGIDPANHKRAILFLFFTSITFYIVAVAIINLSGIYTGVFLLTVLSGPVMVLLLYIYDRNVLALEKILLKTHLCEFFNTTPNENHGGYCMDLSELLKNGRKDIGERILKISITDINNRLERDPRELVKDILEQFPLLHDEVVVNGISYKQRNDILKRLNRDMIEYDKVAAVVRQLDSPILVGVVATTFICGLMYTGLNVNEVVGVADSTGFTDFIQGFVSGATGLQVIVGNIAFDVITSRA